VLGFRLQNALNLGVAKMVNRENMARAPIDI